MAGSTPPVGQLMQEEAAAQNRGLMVALLLAALTLIEFFIAIGFDSMLVVVPLLSVFAVAKAWVILVEFMHLLKLWRGEGGH